jgi:4-aminobutyrate aminotransferase-like enzyme
MVWGVETQDHGSQTAAEWANAIVLACYQGRGGSGDGIHLLGPLAKKVVRIAPPLTISTDEATAALDLMDTLLKPLAQETRSAAVLTTAR